MSQPTLTKAKAPAVVRQGLAENILPHRLVRLRPGQPRHSNRTSPDRNARTRQLCPVCRERSALTKRLALALFGRLFAADVCQTCHDAAGISASYRASAAHQLAQQQLYREGACHA
jgi:hypothetical protein